VIQHVTQRYQHHYLFVSFMQIPGYGKNVLRKQLQYDSAIVDTILDALQQRIDTEVYISHV
jgi:hypothetical protein